ncbi:MAG: hypothetical protein R3C52_04975 [Hyphomonadaceae bacterium]
MLIEKKLTLAVVLAVVMESAGVLIWAGAASERLKEVEVRLASQAQMAERLARVEVHLQLQSQQLDRIEEALAERAAR